jgi:hypothetical protein
MMSQKKAEKAMDAFLATFTSSIDEPDGTDEHEWDFKEGAVAGRGHFIRDFFRRMTRMINITR